MATPLDARCFLTSRSVPYQLKPLVAWPMRGRWTLALWGKKNTQIYFYELKKKDQSKSQNILRQKEIPKNVGNLNGRLKNVIEKKLCMKKKYVKYKLLNKIINYYILFKKTSKIKRK